MKRYQLPHRIAGSLTLLLSCLLLASCSNDDLLPETASNPFQESIQFGISAPESQTRASASEGIASHFVLRSPENSDTLCVSLTTSVGITPTEPPTQEPTTRSAPITSLEGYGAFNVVAYWRTDGTLRSQFYLDETVTLAGSNLWQTTTNIYYWPGTDHTLQFYAYAPNNVGITPPDAPSSTTLSYTVPPAVADQKDVVVATTTQLAGNSNSVVPLTFSHICTAVRFVVGSEMQPGTLKQITLKGVRNSGTYNMATQQWSHAESSANFTQTLTWSATSGEEIAEGEKTFMMLPQTLPEGAEIEVVFDDALTGQERTLSSVVTGQEWPIGQTVTYRLSISPDYELDFTSSPALQDAHYIIYPITLKADQIVGGWEVTSDQSWATLRTDLTSLQEQGYWIEGDQGTSTISSTTSGNDITLYAFLEENIGNASRSATFSLRPKNNPAATPKEFTFEQLCPAWSSTENFGAERIEDGQDVWGFKYPADFKITYKLENNTINILFGYAIGLLYAFRDNISIGGIFDPLTIIVSYKSAAKIGENPDDGLSNTIALYNYEGVSEAANVENLLIQLGATVTYSHSEGANLNPSKFAVLSCVKKNKFKKVEQTYNEVTIYRPQIDNANILWYLPARNESTAITDAGYPLTGEYWTSTAVVNDNINAYKYTTSPSPTTASEDRNTLLKVRAVRRKP